MVKQNKLFHKYRAALEELKKQDFESLFEHNEQEVPAGRDEVHKIGTIQTIVTEYLIVLWYRRPTP